RRKGIRRRRDQLGSEFPYVSKQHLLSKGELVFYQSLHKAIAPSIGISMKVRLADVITCPADQWDATPGRRVCQKHLDFVLYEIATSRIVAAIELDDRSHFQSERRKRDQFLNRALATAQVTLVRFRAASSYEPNAIRRTLNNFLSQPPIRFHR